MLSQRVYNILKFFSEQSEPNFISETKFEYDEILELKNEGYLSSTIKGYYEFKGASPRGKDAYSITYKGKDALILHDKEVKRIEEETQRSKENLKIAKSSRKWAVVAAWVGVVSVIVSIILTILPMLLSK